MQLNDEQVQVKILRAATGQINEDDVLTAKAAKGIVIGFQVAMDRHVQEVAKKERVLIRNYEIIYNLIEELADVMDSMLAPVTEEVEVARAKVKKVFTLTNGQTVAGCEVIKGNIIRGTKVHVMRGVEGMNEGDNVGDGRVTSLKLLKEEVKEVKKGSECGILIEPTVAVEQGDIIISYKVEKV
jgi:translation initiation factor IF-2